jgi:hypothetical protein
MYWKCEETRKHAERGVTYNMTHLHIFFDKKILKFSTSGPYPQISEISKYQTGAL